MQVTPELIEEISRQPLLGILSTVNPREAPRAMPVFYEYDGHTFNMTSYANLFKVRNIRQNPEVCLVIVDTVSYGDTLTVMGRAELVEDGVYEMTQKLNIRYLGEGRGRINRERFLQDSPRIIIRMTPERCTTASRWNRPRALQPRGASQQIRVSTSASDRLEPVLNAYGIDDRLDASYASKPLVLTAFVSDTTMALIEDGAVLGSMQLDTGTSDLTVRSDHEAVAGQVG